MYDVVIETYDLNDRRKLEDFLSRFDLVLEADIEKTYVALEGQSLVGTCSLAGNVIKNLAVCCNYASSGIASKLITNIMNDLFNRDIHDVFVFTKKENTVIFKTLGFKEVSSTQKVILMENARVGIRNYLNRMKIESGIDDGEKAAIVMNCNPLTSGHLYLIEKVSSENEQVIIFLVEEDRSIFPFELRLDFLRKCTSHFENVHVIPGGRYIIASNTFPTYFLREEEKSEEYIGIDLDIFARYIAPVFNIKRRYVGSEPYCRVTNLYNQGMKQMLPQFGIDVIEVERKEKDGEPISASSVREIIKSGRMADLESMLCKDVYEFLNSKEAEAIVDKIRRSVSSH